MAAVNTKRALTYSPDYAPRGVQGAEVARNTFASFVSTLQTADAARHAPVASPAVAMLEALEESLSPRRTVRRVRAWVAAATSGLVLFASFGVWYAASLAVARALAQA